MNYYSSWGLSLSTKQGDSVLSDSRFMNQSTGDCIRYNCQSTMKYRTLYNMLSQDQSLVFGPDSGKANFQGLCCCLESQLAAGQVLEAEDVSKQIHKIIDNNSLEVDALVLAELYRSFALLSITKDEQVRASQALQKNRQMIAAINSPQEKELQKCLRHFAVSKYCLLAKNSRLAQMEMGSLTESMRLEGFGALANSDLSICFIKHIAVARYLSSAYKLKQAVKCYQKALKDVDLQADSPMLNQALLAGSELGYLLVASGEDITGGMRRLKQAYENGRRLMPDYHPYVYQIATNLMTCEKLQQGKKGQGLDQDKEAVQLAAEAKEVLGKVSQGASQKELNQIMELYKKGVESTTLRDRIPLFKQAIQQLQKLKCFATNGWFGCKFKLALAESYSNAQNFEELLELLPTLQEYYQQNKVNTGIRGVKIYLIKARLHIFNHEYEEAKTFLQIAERFNRQGRLGYQTPLKEVKELIDHPKSMIRIGTQQVLSKTISSRHQKSRKGKPNEPPARQGKKQAKLPIKDIPGESVAGKGDSRVSPGKTLRNSGVKQEKQRMKETEAQRKDKKQAVKEDSKEEGKEEKKEKKEEGGCCIY